jgi:hypothetical protein
MTSTCRPWDWFLWAHFLISISIPEKSWVWLSSKGTGFSGSIFQSLSQPLKEAELGCCPWDWFLWVHFLISISIPERSWVWLPSKGTGFSGSTFSLYLNPWKKLSLVAVLGTDFFGFTFSSLSQSLKEAEFDCRPKGLVSLDLVFRLFFNWKKLSFTAVRRRV